MNILGETISLLNLALYNSTGYLFVVAGILISIRFMGYPDLTVDGSFTFGAALYAIAVYHGYPLFLAFLFAALGGALAGLMTTSINRYLAIGKIMSSVIIMLGLLTIAPHITGGSTIGLLNNKHLLAAIQNWDLKLALMFNTHGDISLHLGFVTLFLLIWIILATAIGFLFSTRIGVQMRYLGSANTPGLLSHKQQNRLLLLGVALGNSMVALGGAIEAERKGGFSINMGLGIILVGLACLVLGESLVKTRIRRDEMYVKEYLLAVLLGVFIYSFVLQLLLRLGLTFFDVRLTSVFFLLVLLAIAARKHPNTGRLF
ncbi:MAG: hypothetical protein KAT83_03835, partial [Candidatus Aenigmarchaeota archaeon]|nr:hypothetical protein [Candidatus Aenigmarchaeota archaeon]